MNTLSIIRVIRAVQTGFAEPVAAFSADITLYVAVFCVADAILPVSSASTFRTYNGGQCFQLLLALPFHYNMDF
jgi:hypothetical protein